jgi:hypothetical protein
VVDCYSDCIDIEISRSTVLREIGIAFEVQVEVEVGSLCNISNLTKRRSAV